MKTHPTSSSTRNNNKNSLLSYSTIGNTLHVLNLINICIYGTLLYLYGNSNSNTQTVFDETWLQEGFCTPHDTRTPNAMETYQTTHDLSGYVMIGIALFGIVVQRTLSSKSSNNFKAIRPSSSSDVGNNKAATTTTSSNVLFQADRLTFWACIGSLGHGAGHFLISNGKRQGFYPDAEVRFIDDLWESTPLMAVLKAGPGYPLFWIPLTKTFMMNTTRGWVVVGLAFLFWAGALWMPTKFGFSFTQAVLFGGMSIDQLLSIMDSQKNTLEYALWPLLTVLPNGMFAWMESVGCTSLPIMQQYGHVLYDAYMASSYILFYLICYSYHHHQTTTTKKKKLV